MKQIILLTVTTFFLLSCRTARQMERIQNLDYSAADTLITQSLFGDRNATISEEGIGATTQLIILDIRTGLVPFSTIVTKDRLSQKSKEELNNTEARNRIQHEAVLLTIHEVGQQITGFLQTR